MTLYQHHHYDADFKKAIWMFEKLEIKHGSQKHRDEIKELKDLCVKFKTLKNKYHLRYPQSKI